jgi:signal transduction histidine kinase
MRKAAFVFILAVMTPSLVLAWLAVRSLRDQQLVLERQQSLLCQGLADAVAKTCDDRLGAQKRDFGLRVESVLAAHPAENVATEFDDLIRQAWPMANVGFAVSLEGTVYSPSLFGRADSRRFRLQNDRFLCSREAVEVFYSTPKGNINLSQLDAKENALGNAYANNSGSQGASQAVGPFQSPLQQQAYANNKIQKRVVTPQNEAPDDGQGASKVFSSETDFRQVVGDGVDGVVGRFLENKLKLLVWYRSPRNPKVVFGAELSLAKIVKGLADEFKAPGFIDSSFTKEVCVALIDDAGKPAALTRPDFKTDWRRPFVSSEVGETLPHWEVAAALLDPKSLTRSAESIRLTLGLLIGVLVLAIGVGGGLVFADLRRQLVLARQKTDFVSNVSHELKTPLTSIRMFSELLAEGRVSDPAKARSYLSIIATETARLTRLINNVLDFARMDRGEKRYEFQELDLSGLAAETVETYRPHLESAGFTVSIEPATGYLLALGDPDALAQALVNLLSNAEKYSTDTKEIRVETGRVPGGGAIEIRVMDRGPGVPKGCEEKIFLQFFRAHDSLNSGIQGSGLGLTLARQIARAHQGDVLYAPRAGGGSVFTIRLPEARPGETS